MVWNYLFPGLNTFLRAYVREVHDADTIGSGTATRPTSSLPASGKGLRGYPKPVGGPLFAMRGP
jgi:hypothetical protein